MNRQPTFSHGLLYSVAPKHLTQLYLGDDVLGDEFDWDESVSPYEGEPLAHDMLGSIREFGAE